MGLARWRETSAGFPTNYDNCIQCHDELSFKSFIFLCLCQCIQILLHMNSICGWKKKKKLQTASVDCSSVSGVIIQLQDVQMDHITRIKWELLLTVLSILSIFFFQTHTTLAVLNRIKNRSLISCGRFRYETRVSPAASTSPAGTCLKNFKKH